LTQKELAERAGLKDEAVRDLEQALNGPTWDTVLALADVLGVSCEAVNRAPLHKHPAKRGRPPKPIESAPKRSRGQSPKERRS
jgi:transcriptional regulator with XRE-family HTH domain